jgi:hypothetical protein
MVEHHEQDQRALGEIKRMDAIGFADLSKGRATVER